MTFDDARESGYLRGVGIRRPSPSVTLVTLVAACALAAGGYVYGKGGDDPGVPATVPVKAVEQPAGADPIVLPSSVDLPSR